MALLNFKYGLKAKLPEVITNGNLYITTDERGLYVDLENKRIHISDFIEVTATEFSEITADTVIASAFYYIPSANALYKWNGSGWNCLNSTADLEEDITTLNTRIDGLVNSVYEVTSDSLDITELTKDISDPHPGDVLVVTSTAHNIKTAYGYTVTDDAGEWVVFDGNVSADNTIFQSDLTLTANVGVHTMPSSGSKTLETTGKSVKQVMDLLFAQEKNPITSRPTFSFSSSGNKSGEVGTYYSLPTATLTMTGAGSYTYGPATGVTVAIGNATLTASGADNKSNETAMSKNSTLTITAGDADKNASNQVQYTDTEKTYNFTAEVTYSDGSIPKTNLGNDYTAGQIKSAKYDFDASSDGQQNGSVSAKYTGFRSVFYGYKAGGSTLDVTNLTSSDIRGLMGDDKPQTAPTTLKPSAMTTNKMQQMFFAFVQPDSGHATKPTVKDATNGAPQTVEGPVTVNVKGANGYTGVNYDVYYVSNAAAAAGELKFTITY